MWCGLNGWWGNWTGGGFGGYGGISLWLMPIISIVVVGLIVWGIVALVRRTAWAGGSSGSGMNSGSALEILNRRYARGEITKQEYDDRKKDLI